MNVDETHIKAMCARQGPFNGVEGIFVRVFIPAIRPLPLLFFLRSFLRMIDELSNDVRGRKYPDHIGKEQCLTPGESIQGDYLDKLDYRQSRKIQLSKGATVHNSNSQLAGRAVHECVNNI